MLSKAVCSLPGQAKSVVETRWGNKTPLFSLILIIAILSSCNPPRDQTQVISTPVAQPQLSDCEPTVTDFCWPTGKDFGEIGTGWLVDSCDGNNNYKFKDRYHIGWDIPASVPDKVFAIADGEIFHVSESASWGKGNVGVFVKHMLHNRKEFLALYGHVQLNEGLLEKFKSGEHPSVKAGDSFATVGPYSGGIHLHFGIVDGATYPPTNLSLGIGWGMMPCPNNGDYNGFTNPYEWITTKSPLVGNVLGFSTTQETLPTPVPTPASTSIELDQSDLSSVLRLLEYAIDKRDLTLIKPLIGDKGVAKAVYSTEFDFVGYNNSEEIIRQLSEALGKNDLLCLGYDNTPSDWAAIFFKGDVDWSSFPKKTNDDSNGIIFGFHKLQQKWELTWVSKLPSYALSNKHEYGCPTLDSVASSTTSLAPINRADYFSVLQWIKYAFANNDVSAFEELVSGDLTQLIYTVNVSAPLKRSDFFAGLSEKLPNKPQCEYFILSSSGDQLTVRTSAWSPPWEMKESCHFDCTPMNPPLINTSVDLSFDLKNNGWELNTMIFGDPEDFYSVHSMDVQKTSCDSVPISSTLPSVPISSELPPLNGQDYYSVLQWVKYALETNAIDVFNKLAAENLAYVLYIEGGEDVTKDEFFRDLSKRLPSGPHCDSFAFLGDSLYVWTSGWSPKWVIDEMCYGGCGPIDPPITSDVIAFSFREDNNGWRMNKIVLEERPDRWASTYSTQVVNCDTVQISSFNSAIQVSTNIPPLNSAEYFSVLQWIKHATLNNDISVFERLILGNSIQLIDGSNVAVNIDKTDLLSELSTRLTSKPNCEFFMFEDSGRLVIRISNWSPSWGVDGDTVVYLILELKDNQWALTSIIYGDNLPSWAQGLEKISFNTISISVGGTTETTCKEARPTRLKDGDFAFVSFYPPLVQRVRSSYGLTNEILARLPIGTAVKIIDGPECADNFLWWKIKVLNSGLQGWTAEADKDAYWLIPCESRKNCGTR